jgi:hypothetical protein
VPLPHEKIQELHASTIAARLSRDALLSGLDRRLVAQLPRFNNESQQILSDLHELNRIDRLADGSMPLVLWLQTAVALAGPRREGADFEKTLRVLQNAAGAGTTATRPQPPPRDDEDAFRGAAPEQAPRTDLGAVRVYVAAAHEDARFVEQLERHLTPLIRSGGALLWHRGKLLGGEDKGTRMRKEVAAADIALVLLSADAFIDESSSAELDALDARMKRDGLRVVPILARPCDWESSAFGSLQPLPRDRRPISIQRNADEAYSEVARSVGAILKDVRDNRRAAPPRTTDDPLLGSDFRTGPRDPRNMGAPPSEDRPRVETALGDIFKRQGIPDLDYVEPEQARGIRLALRTMGRGLVIEGPTQIGKTTAVREALKTVSVQEIDCRTPAFEDEIRLVLKAWKLDGHLVIDDAHLIPDGLLRELARFMRWLADVPRPTGKVTLIGINKTGRRLVANQRDLAGRIDEIRMARQPDEKIRELIEKGERVANLRFARKAEMIREARGSFRLAQELCFLTATHARSGEPAPPIEVVAAHRIVQAGPDDVRLQMREALSSELEDRLFEFVSADKDKPSPGEATPGACFALLWLLAEGDEMRTPIGQAKKMYPALGPAFTWIENGGLGSFLQDRELLAELLSCTAGELTAQDPRLDYYLNVLDWDYLARRAVLDVVFDKGELIFSAKQADGSAGASTQTSGTPTILDAPEYPWGNPKAVQLRDILMGAYSDPGTAAQIARISSIRLERVALDGSLEAVWTGILNAASRQAALTGLLETIRADDHARAYGPALDACVPELAAANRPSRAERG